MWLVAAVLDRANQNISITAETFPSLQKVQLGCAAKSQGGASVTFNITMQFNILNAFSDVTFFGLIFAFLQL